jgi:hypothetical protein
MVLASNRSGPISIGPLCRENVSAPNLAVACGTPMGKRRHANVRHDCLLIHLS